MEKWFILNKHENYNKIKNDKRFSSFQKLILANRDITEDFQLDSILNPNLENLRDPLDLYDMKKGIEILMEHMRKGSRILIVGDYDQDGVAAIVILYKTIKSIYDQVDYSIPDRIEDGYGLNKTIVKKAYDGDYKLIITCDNGIAAFEAVDYANELGIDTIITDHHEVVEKDGKEILPKASAIIDPFRQDDKSKFKKICGAMVAFKFVKALDNLYGKNLGLDSKYIDKLSQFAALGTVSDMMPIVDENRIIVVEGLKELNKRENLGIRVLLEELNWMKEVTIYTIGFLIGPTINSSGRIYTARLGVELFIDNDQDTIKEYAKTLVELNNERKQMTKDSLDLVIGKIEDEKLYNSDIIILYENKVHESICGLVAGRVKDRYQRPTIILTDSGQDGLLKGSGRSIDAYNMFESLNIHRDSFESFGGHAMACGLSIEKEKLVDLSYILNKESKLESDDFVKEINIDANLKYNQISMKLIEEINQLKPFGLNYSEPLFASKNVKVLEAKVLGVNKNVLRLILSDSTNRIQAVSFDVEKLFEKYKEKYYMETVDDLINLEGNIFDFVYKININTFNGISNIQLNIVSMR